MKNIALILASGSVGAILALYFTQPPTVTPNDLVRSYEKGFKDALDAERPSERLEYVCAALWFKQGEQQ
jgi:hypothetical protein